MKITALRLGTIFSTLFLVAFAASAQNNRSAVSVNGSDANPCTVVSPCRSFAVAMTHTNAGGEVIALDSGGYGPFTISQAVSVIGAPGVHAALTVSSGNGITVTAGSSDNVRIRNLNVTMTGGGDGIYATVYGSLSIENCSVNGGHYGISLNGDTASHATVVDTAVRAAADTGYFIVSRAVLVRCRAENIGVNGAGLTVRDSVATDGIVSAVDFVSVGNVGSGVTVGNSGYLPDHHPFLNLDHALISNNGGNGIDLFVSNGPSNITVRVTNSMVTDNGGVGFDQSFYPTATFGSMNNNLVAGNGLGDTFGMITVIASH